MLNNLNYILFNCFDWEFFFKNKKKRKPKQVSFEIYPFLRHWSLEIQVVWFKTNESIQSKHELLSPIQLKHG